MSCRVRNPRDDRPIGLRIARIRKAKGILQAEIALRVGIRQKVLSEIETGYRTVHPALVSCFAEALDVDPRSLTERDLVEVTPEQRRLLDAFARIPTDEGREDAFRIVNAIGALQEHAA